MTDYDKVQQKICEEFLTSNCLFDFLSRVEKLIGIHLSIMDMDLSDPSQTNPLEPDAYTGRMKPCVELIVNNIKCGYLSVPYEARLTDELKPVLKQTAAFVSKMPEIVTKITTGSDAYLAGMYELLFSTNLERMASLRAQIGLSRFTVKSWCWK